MRIRSSTAVVSRPRATLRLAPFAARGAAAPRAQDVIQLLRQHAPATAAEADLDSDERQWWLAAPAHMRQDLPNPEAAWRIRVSDGGFVEFQLRLGAQDDEQKEIVLPGQRLEAAVAEHLQPLLNCARGLGLEGEALVSLAFEGVDNLRLLGPGREGRPLGRPDLTLPNMRLPMLSKARGNEFQASLDVIWCLAGWPEGSPFAGELVERG